MVSLEEFNHPRVMTDTQTRIHKLAVKRLIELEKEIEEKHDSKLMCAIELEFNHRQSDGQMPDIPLMISQYDESPFSSFDRDAANSFIKAPFVQVFELDGDEYQHRYEFKISPRRYIKEYQETHKKQAPELYKLYAPHVIAKAAQSIRALTQKKTPELLPGYQAQFMALDPVQTEETAGIHVNLSLWDKEYRISKQDEVLPKASIAMQKLLFPLVIESENSLYRFGAHNRVATEFRRERGDEKTGNSLGVRSENVTPAHRIEDRLSGADADPALSTLITVGGVYWALEHGNKSVPLDESVKDTLKIPNTAEEYKIFLQAFEKSDAARELLGDELYTEITTLRRAQFNQMVAPQKVAGNISKEGTLMHPAAAQINSGAVKKQITR